MLAVSRWAAAALITCLLAAARSDAVDLVLDTPVSGSISRSEAPLVYCYDAPQFNVWRTFHEVEIEVVAPEGYIPNVHAASRDDMHGLVDGYIRDGTGDVLDMEEQARRRSIARSIEYFASPADLLFECPPVWAPSRTSCAKLFSPFGRSCVSIASNKDSATFVVLAKSRLNLQLPLLLLAACGLLIFSRKLAKSKVLWYSSGVSLSLLAGLAVVLLLLARRYRVPGATSATFTLLAIAAYWLALGRYALGMLRVLLIAHWEMALAYCAVLAAGGILWIARVRRDPARKHDFRIQVLWTIRATGLALLSRSSRSGAVQAALLFSAFVAYLILRILDRKPEPSKDGTSKVTAKSKTH